MYSAPNFLLRTVDKKCNNFSLLLDHIIRQCFLDFPAFDELFGQILLTIKRRLMERVTKNVHKIFTRVR